MHSSQYLRLAQAADSFSTVIVALFAMPAEQGTYPAAHCLLEREDGKFTYSLGVLPVEPGREAFFVNSIHGIVTRERALELFNERTARDASRLGEVEDNEILRIRAAA